MVWTGQGRGKKWLLLTKFRRLRRQHRRDLMGLLTMNHREFYDILMLMRHVDGVVAWARCRLTNAALEGNNSRIRAISQRGHGYRNPDNLMVVLIMLPGGSPRRHHPNARRGFQSSSGVTSRASPA